jgi:dephospho-CoA kinase
MDGGSARAVPFVGLTGGLASGKSTALELLEQLGAATISADAVVHQLYARPEIQDLLADRWGDVLAAGGVVDRGAIAERAFSDPAELEWLEQLLWPRVRAEVASFRAEAQQREPRPRAIVVEVPLLFESGLEGQYDVTVAVVAPDDARAAWAVRRGHAVRAERERRQLEPGEKAARADHVIRNDGSIEDLRESLAELLSTIESGGA